MGFWSSCCGLPMLAEMTVSKGRSPLSPFARRARYSSLLTASSPRTAYLAALTCGLTLSMVRAFILWVEEKVRRAEAGKNGGERGIKVCAPSLVTAAAAIWRIY